MRTARQVTGGYWRAILDFSVGPVADGYGRRVQRASWVLPVTLGFEHLKRADTILTLSQGSRARWQRPAACPMGEDALDAVGLGED